MKDNDIKLTDKELLCITDADLIKTKVRASRKIRGILEQAQLNIQHYLKTRDHRLPEEIQQVPPKISIGENYRQLPYQVLDFPRLFGKQHVFAYRTMFWWGHFFSHTLHLGGKYIKPDHARRLLHSLENPEQLESIFFCCNESPWHYHYEKDNYLPLDKISPQTLEKQLSGNRFLKISAITTLDHWHAVPDMAVRHLKNFLQLTGW